eukprot:1731804-Prymnesium_polylepis.2
MAQEVERLRECHSQYVLQFHCSLRSARQDALWVVTEYCEGGSLLGAMRAQRAPLSEPQVAAALAGVLSALDHLHTALSLRMLHRDVKAANCLLTRDGALRLADFGVAAQLGHTLSRRNTAIGSE